MKNIPGKLGSVRQKYRPSWKFIVCAIGKQRLLGNCSKCASEKEKTFDKIFLMAASVQGLKNVEYTVDLPNVEFSPNLKPS